MSENKALPPTARGGARYRIRVRGRVPESGLGVLEGHELTTTEDPNGGVVSTISGWMPDQAAFTGLLRALNDLRLTVLDVQRLEDSDD